jgi:indolepyruvate ferredoxin oxidoreductase beta subunit
MPPSDPRLAEPLSIVIAALGGEGGGVLTDWLVSAAEARSFPVQSTSIPGVAQRTGATTYFIELLPVPAAELGGRKPVFALYPSPGHVDVAIASELIEAGRLLENALVTPERTLLIASTHRIFSIAEKSAMGDGRFDTGRVLKAAAELARRAVLGDLAAAARGAGSVLNAVVLGVLAGADALPFAPDELERAIRAKGVAVDSNLRGFAAGLAIARGETPAAVAAAPDQPAHAPDGPLDAALRRRFPIVLHDIVGHGVARLLDYQDAAYAGLYLDRLTPLVAAERGAADLPVSRETARYLALWMSYEDVIRVADLKTRRARLERVRREVGAAADQPLRIADFLKPGLEELSALLPPALGRALMRWASRHDRLRRWHVGLHLRTDTIAGFALLRLLAALRRWRKRSYRFAEEQVAIEDWLGLIGRALARDPALALETAETARLLKGYGDTARRGRRNYAAIVDRLIRPALVGAPVADAADAVRAARAAALADPEGPQLDSMLDRRRPRPPLPRAAQ